MAEEISGQCLCGAVQFTVTGPFDSFYMCHCSRCRKRTGSAHAANIFASADSIRWIAGQEKIKHFKLPEAKRFSTCFCTECGSAVPNVSGPIVVIPAGTLNGDPGIRPQNNVFWADRAPWYDDGLKAERCEAYPPR